MITDVIIVCSSSSSRFNSKYCKMLFYVIALISTTLIVCASTTSIFRPSSTSEHHLRRLTVDPLTGTVYVGAVNHLYQLDSDLNLVVNVSTGPVQDDKDCADFDRDTGQLDCTDPQPQLSSTDNYNQVTSLYDWIRN